MLVAAASLKKTVTERPRFTAKKKRLELSACAGEAAPFEAQGKQAEALRAVLEFPGLAAWAKLFRAPTKKSGCTHRAYGAGRRGISNWKCEIQMKAKRIPPFEKHERWGTRKIRDGP